MNGSLRNCYGKASTFRYQKMLMWEGITMVASLVGGAAALFYYIFRERREGKRLREFFAAFTHEIKTPLASARLKSEILKERIKDPASLELVHKILGDVGRLSLQLENSLFLADTKAGDPYFETVSIQGVIESLKDLWPQLEIICPNDLEVRADRRMLDTVMANIFQNAVLHGHAKKVVLETNEREGIGEIIIRDDGDGFIGDRASLGTLFQRHYTGSGSGIGLYLVRTLIQKLKGSVEFRSVPKGFSLTIELPKSI